MEGLILWEHTQSYIAQNKLVARNRGHIRAAGQMPCLMYLHLISSSVAGFCVRRQLYRLQSPLFNRSNLETISFPPFQNWPFLFALPQNEILDYACYCQLQTTEARKKSKNHKIVKVESNFWRSNTTLLRAQSNKAGFPMPCTVGSCISWRMKTPSSTTNVF